MTLITNIIQFIKRFIRSIYGKTIAFYFLWQVIFLILLNNTDFASNISDRGPEDLLTISLATAVYFVVFFNTGIFLRDSKDYIGTKTINLVLDDTHKIIVKRKFNSFYNYLLISTFLSGALGLFILLGGFGGLNDKYFSWKSVLRINELASVILFGWFFLANITVQQGLRIVLQACEKKGAIQYLGIKSFYGEMRLLFITVDAPGFLGLLFITYISHSMYPENIRFIYWHGFIAGAIALHIAYSQMALALVSSRRKGEYYFSPV